MPELKNLMSYKTSKKKMVGYQYTIEDPEDESQIYLIYTNPAMAIGEVAYSRLSSILGLPCIHSEYAYINNHCFPLVASVSTFKRVWKGYRSSSLANQDDYESFVVLDAMLKSKFDTRGYTDTDKQFIRARNGQNKWVNIELNQKLKGSKNLSYASAVTPQDIVSINNYGNIVPKIANLTVDDIAYCADIPDWEYIYPINNQASDFVIERLIEVKKIAESIMSL